jgi:UrcA family protein
MKLSLALSALALALPVAAFAGQPEANSEAVRISYQKTDLLQPAAVARLEQRVRVAAHRICDTTGRVNLDAIRVSEQCYNVAVADALRQLDSAKSYAAAALRTPTSG